MAFCYLCGDQPRDDELLDHLCRAHPVEFGDGPEQWPDGQYVVIDQTDYTADEIGGVA